MEKISFTDPQTGESVDFLVEEETILNGIRYLLVSEEENAYILKEIRSDGEDTVYEMVDEDVEFSAIAKIFSELADESTEIVVSDE